MRAPLLGLALLLCSGPALAEADLRGFWNLAFDAQPNPEMLAKLPPDAVVIEDSGAPEYPRMVFGGLRLTPEALAHAEAWRPEDEMTLQKVCSPPSIVYAVQGPFPFEVEQTRDSGVDAILPRDGMPSASAGPASSAAPISDATPKLADFMVDQLMCWLPYRFECG